MARQILDFFEIHVGDYRLSQVHVHIVGRLSVWCVCGGEGWREGRRGEGGRRRERERREREREREEGRGRDELRTIIPLQVMTINRNIDVILKAFQQAIHDK